MDYRKMTSPCGLDCFNCPMYHAKSDENLRQLISKELDIPVEKSFCIGCRNFLGIIEPLKMTEPCNVYKCIEKKGLEFCCDCSDFPCDHLHPYADRATEVPHNTKVFNLCLIKKMGHEKWAESKAMEVKKKYFHGKFHL